MELEKSSKIAELLSNTLLRPAFYFGNTRKYERSKMRRTKRIKDSTICNSTNPDSVVSFSGKNNDVNDENIVNFT